MKIMKRVIVFLTCIVYAMITPGSVFGQSLFVNGGIEGIGENLNSDDGRVGVGVNYPKANLHVAEDLQLGSNLLTYYKMAVGDMGPEHLSVGNGDVLFKRILIDDGIGVPLDQMLLNANGQMSLGRMIYSDHELAEMNTAGSDPYLLFVDGGIVAEEIKVELDEDWGDYVFDEDYPLESLEEVEGFISKNSHLPGMPSAAEIEQGGGLNIEAITHDQQIKIEELFLYVIDMNERLQSLERENQRLKLKLNGAK